MLRRDASWPYDSLDVCDSEFRDKCDQRMFEARCDIVEIVAQTKETIRTSWELLAQIDRALARK